MANRLELSFYSPLQHMCHRFTTTALGSLLVLFCGSCYMGSSSIAIIPAKIHGAPDGLTEVYMSKDQWTNTSLLPAFSGKCTSLFCLPHPVSQPRPRKLQELLFIPSWKPRWRMYLEGFGNIRRKTGR